MAPKTKRPKAQPCLTRDEERDLALRADIRQAMAALPDHRRKHVDHCPGCTSRINYMFRHDKL